IIATGIRNHKTTRMANVWLATPGVSAASSTSIRHKRAARRWIGGAKRIRPESYAEKPPRQESIVLPHPGPLEILSHMPAVGQPRVVPRSWQRCPASETRETVVLASRLIAGARYFLLGSSSGLT